MTYVIGTAGHVDHGKSTLVKALTGIDPDRLAEEKEREMTIDLGFAWMSLPSGESVGIVDVPGHRDFIENMLAGVGGIDLALLVIAADEGVMPQTREHLAILDLLNIPAAVVALTKIDMIADPDWLDLVALDVSEVLRGTVLEGAPIVPVSARTGAGLDQLVETLGAALAERPPRADLGRPRLPVDRVFTISGFGTVATGTLTDGSLRVGDEIEIMPGGRRARIRGLQSHKEAVDTASPGSRVAVNLTGVDKLDLKRGDVLALPGLLRPTTLIDVRFRHLPDTGRPLKHNAEVKFFSGATETLAHVRLVGDREMMPGQDGWLQLRLAEPLALDKGDRFILRYPSPPETLGGGVVLDAHPPHRWRRFKPEVIARFETLAVGTPEDLLLHALEGQPAMLAAQAGSALGLSPGEVASAVEKLQQYGEVLALPGGWLAARSSWNRMAERITREAADFHQAYPLRPGMPREALRSRLGLDSRLFQALIGYAVEQSLVTDEGKIIRLPGHVVRFSAAQHAAVEALLGQIADNPVNTPGLKEAASLVGDDVLQMLIERGDLVVVGTDVMFDRETYQWLVAQVEQHIEQHGSITVAQARDLFNSSRKYVLALLEHLDAAGITKRLGDERVLKRPAR
jgi:selenocysteine-specific elongation factor